MDTAKQLSVEKKLLKREKYYRITRRNVLQLVFLFPAAMVAAALFQWRIFDFEKDFLLYIGFFLLLILWLRELHLLLSHVTTIKYYREKLEKEE